MSVPPAPTTPAQPQRSFWGWRIVLFAAISLAMTAPGQTLGVSVFVDHFISSLDVSRSQVSVAYLIGTLLGSMTLPLVGRGVDRRGVRTVMTLVGVGFGIALAGMAGVGSMVTLVVGFTGIRMLGQGSLSLVSTTSVALWFNRRRGLALGICVAVGSALMSLAPLALAGLIAQVGWRNAWLGAALVVWLVVVPIARWGMHDSPASIGQRPDGLASDDPSDDADAGGMSWTRAEATRTLMFWSVTAAVAVSGMITTALAFHQISLLGERGLTVAQAAANFVPQTGAAIALTVLVGLLVDRLAPRLLIAISMGSLGLALVLAQVAAPGWRAVAFGVAVGAASGAVRTQEAAAFPRYFGVEHIGAIRGLVMTVTVAATALGPFVLGIGYDRLGSYGPVLTALLVLPVAVVLLATLARAPTPALLDEVRGRRLPVPSTVS